MERRFTINHDTSIVETRDANGSPTITGLASVFYDPSNPQTEYTLWDNQVRGKAVERINRGAFDKALQDNNDVRLLFNHDPNWLLARTASGTLNLSVEAKGLRYTGKLDPSNPQAATVISGIQRGDLTGSSFGFKVTKDTWTTENGTTVRYIEQVSLFDVSPVTYPAYNAATTGFRSEGHDEEAFESFLKNETEKRFEKLNQYNK